MVVSYREGGGQSRGATGIRLVLQYRHQLIRSKHPLPCGSGQLYNWLAIVTKGMTVIRILMLSLTLEEVL